jgi:hypothetical protein
LSAAAIVEHRRPRGKNRPLLHLAAQQPARRRLDDLELGDRCLAHAFDVGKPYGRRRDHFRERAKGRDQRLRERLDVAPRQGAEQHRLQQLVIGERIGTDGAEAFAQTLAMAVIVRLRCCGLPFALALFSVHGIFHPWDRTRRRDRAARRRGDAAKDDGISAFCNRLA